MFWPRRRHRRTLRGDIDHILRRLHDLKELTVATAAELNARVDALTTAVDAAKARIAEDFQALRDQLDQVVSGDNPALDDAVNRLDASIASLDAVDPDSSNPPAEPVA